MRSYIISIALLTSLQAFAKPIIVSGLVKAGETQVFHAPMSDSWKTQIQWMLPEGEVANKGDIVVVYDSGSIATSIDQDKVALDAAKDEYKRIEQDGAQKILEAQFQLKKTILLVEKAKIDANVPKANISTYDYEQHQLTLEKAIIENHKAEISLRKAKTEAKANTQKQQLEIRRLEASLTHNQEQLEKMSLKASNSGPILYADHPWNGNKLFAGATVQPGWKVAEIPSTAGLYLEAWIHEVDAIGIKEGQTADLKFDAFRSSSTSSTLTELSTQPEKRQDWGQGMYYRAKFTFNTDLPLLPGMSGSITLPGEKNES
ncbi:HlyD family secretion protein [Pseudoalteromonas piscicida]|uniref:HlyD family secretion protein n=1 Tax=Pseudoalteromonas piscicida TaxID=43662 RepID=UPI000E35F67F|nr:HlyD family efflux transporter periplasmic adaptor subunit [Pseudoalteromonas piscicida]AXR00432.1 HlyD family efflux transporter periplasmic adaptor subunit [Pseudoalteromonas piscicida]